jgi:hypothetical protein
MIENPKSSPLEKDVLDKSIFNLSRRQTKVFEPEVINQAIDRSMVLSTHKDCMLIRSSAGRRSCRVQSYFNMVQARKETPDHVSVQEECLNISCPKEFSLVGINRAILKNKNFGRGICKPIFLITR